jgi:hypothetical protein
MGSWEAITTDANLELGDKIFPNGNKVQLKRVNTRAEYLLKILKKQIDLKLGVVRSYCIYYNIIYFNGHVFNFPTPTSTFNPFYSNRDMSSSCN